MPTYAHPTYDPTYNPAIIPAYELAVLGWLIKQEDSRIPFEQMPREYHSAFGALMRAGFVQMMIVTDADFPYIPYPIEEWTPWAGLAVTDDGFKLYTEQLKNAN